MSEEREEFLELKEKAEEYRVEAEDWKCRAEEVEEAWWVVLNALVLAWELLEKIPFDRAGYYAELDEIKRAIVIGEGKL